MTIKKSNYYIAVVSRELYVFFCTSAGLKSCKGNYLGSSISTGKRKRIDLYYWGLDYPAQVISHKAAYKYKYLIS